MTNTVKDSATRLLNSIDAAETRLNGALSALANAKASIPADPVNAPIEAATVMLGRFGFVVLHRDMADRALGALAMVDGSPLIDELLAYMQAQRHFAD